MTHNLCDEYNDNCAKSQVDKIFIEFFSMRVSKTIWIWFIKNQYVDPNGKSHNVALEVKMAYK